MYRDIRMNRCKFLGKFRTLFACAQKCNDTRLYPTLPKFFLALAKHFVDCIHTSEFLYEFGCRLLSYATHTGDVVGRIATKCLVIDYLPRRKPVALLYSVLVIQNGVGKTLTKRENFYTWPNELERVHVAGRNNDVDVFFFSHLLHDSAEHIVC